ncbi:hypothetical protein BGZ74_005210, partial [Mortierella antarctica]
MNQTQIPGRKTSTKTSMVNGVIATVTTITAPGQPTRVTTFTKRPCPGPCGEQAACSANTPEPPRKIGFFSKLKSS